MALDQSQTGFALQTMALEKSYGAVSVLHKIDIAMEPGEFLVLVGPSGCGKSTLLNCIVGLEEISGGTLLIGGKDVTAVPPKDRDIAMVFQSYALYPTMTVAQNIGFGMKIRRVPKPQITTSIVYVTHDQIEAMTLATRIVIMKAGHVPQIGTPQEIYDRPANTFVADSMGSPPMNLIAAEVTNSGLLFGGITVPMGLGWGGDRLLKQVIAGIRPEHFSIAQGQPDLAITPTMIENTRAESYISFNLGGTPITAKVPGRMADDSTTAVDLTLARTALCLFDTETGLRIER